MGQELEDRFGRLPEPVLNLLYQLKLKILCRAAGVQSVGVENDYIIIKAESLETVDRKAMERRLNPGTLIGRRQISIPRLNNEEVWKTEVEKALNALGQQVSSLAGPIG